MRRIAMCVFALICLSPVSAGGARASVQAASLQAASPQAPAPPAAALQPYVVDYYYRVKWGHFGEFLELYKKNHYPILQKLQESGDIISMSAAYPRNHANEPARWDMRFTIVYRDVLAEHLYAGDALIEKLYPDQATFKKEEQRRFELLLEHTDIPVVVEDAKGWK